MNLSKVLILLSIVVNVSCTTTGRKCNKEYTVDGRFNVLKEGGEGTEELRTITASCTGSSERGVINAKGEMLIPPGKYFKWHVISNNRAVVQIYGDKKPNSWRFATIKDGVGEILPWDIIIQMQDYHTERNSPVFTYMALKSWTQTESSYRDVGLITPYSKNIKVLKRLGGPGVFNNNTMGGQYDQAKVAYRLIRRQGNVFYISFTDETKQAASQLITLTGVPVSPKIGLVHTFFYNNSSMPPQTLTQVANFKTSDFNNLFGILWPINYSGELTDLPPGAIGVHPLIDYQKKLSGWMVFYPGPTGIEFETHTGTLAAIPQTSSGERYIGFSHIYKDNVDRYFISAVKTKEGKWVAFNDMSAQRDPYLNNQTFNDVLSIKVATHRQAQSNMDADRARWAAIHAEEDRKRAKERYAEALDTVNKSSNICGHFREVILLGAPYSERYAETCPIYSIETATQLSLAGATSRKIQDRISQIKKQDYEYKEKQKDLERIRSSYSVNSSWGNGPLNIANPGTPSAQQQQYQMERQINRQIFNKDWDPYK